MTVASSAAAIDPILKNGSILDARLLGQGVDAAEQRPIRPLNLACAPLS
jgi:hypothetical protein